MTSTTTRYGTGSRSGERVARLRHIGVSTLPLALFLTGTLGYEQIVAVTRSPATSASAIATVPVPAVTTSSAARPTFPGATATAALKDQRSLLAGAEAHATVRGPAELQRRPQPGLGGGAADRDPEVALHLGDDTPVPLKIDVAGRLQPGAYAIVRGLPQNAVLSHGIAAGAGSWLVDGVDVPELALGMRAGTPGLLVLDVVLLTRDSRLITQHRIDVAVHAVRPPPAPTHIVPPSPITMPLHAPEIGAPIEVANDLAFMARAAASPATYRAAARAGADPASAPAAPRAADVADMKLAVSKSDVGTNGRDRLRLAIETSGRIPDGAYIVLRGVPKQAALTRGLPIGPDVWLLSLLEIEKLEMVLGDGPLVQRVALDAKLVSGDGQLLAEVAHRYDGAAIVTVESTASAPAAVPVAATTPPAPRLQASSISGAGRPLPQPTQQKDSARPGAPVTPPAAARTPQLPAIDLPARDAALARGRRMLQLGNIAVARPLLQRAAGEGSSEAAALLGASYDGQWLKRQGVLGMTGDPAAAQNWYEEARRLGANDIERLVASINQAKR